MGSTPILGLLHMMMTPKTSSALLAVFLTACAGLEPLPTNAAEDRARMRARAEAVAAPKLVALLDRRRENTFTIDQFYKPDTSRQEYSALSELGNMRTPEGYRLKIRLWNLGVPVTQALALAQDPQIQGRLLEAARFQSGTQARAEGLLVLATKKNPDHLKYFKEALLDRDVSIQFAAVEALRVWAQPEALPLLLDAARRNWSPLIRLWSARAAWALGDNAGKEMVRAALADSNRVTRALAALTLGDMGGPEDLDAVLARLDREGDNPFVMAELCLSGLKLFAKKAPVPPDPAPARPARREEPRVLDLFEMEPLIVTAPRLRVSGRHQVDPRIDVRLAGLLEKIATDRPEVLVYDDPTLQEIVKLTIPSGFALNIRYTDIRYLLTMGLAGTRNYTLISRLETIYKSSPDSGIKAFALVALGHDPSRMDVGVFRDALIPTNNIQTRFGAVEGLAAQKNPLVKGVLADAAQSDESLVVRIFAAQALGRWGDPQGVDLLRRYLNHEDFVVRFLATYYLGQLGDDADFERILINLERETEDAVTAENCLAVLRMSL
ncbi:MAG: HEAT repeat domain-containing protein [Elusimicrobia bacterium]|nr:HEAT repeat domain-containing protein [Elusimicrobiota bacterium]